MNRCKAGTKPDVMLKYAKMLAKEWIDDRSKFEFIQFTPNTMNGLIISYN